MTKIALSLDDLKVLAERSKQAGTQDRFIDLMFEWVDGMSGAVEAMRIKCEDIARDYYDTTWEGSAAAKDIASSIRRLK